MKSETFAKLTRQLFVVGAQRSGTTYLHKLLSEHPQIEMNEPWWPEPKFFLQPDAGTRLDEYARIWSAKKNALVRGEKSVSYMLHPEVAERISRSFPDASIIFILRDPVVRAVSNYWYTANSGLEDKDIDEVLTNESYQNRPYDKTRITGCPPFDYLKRGKYIDYIESYLNIFDQNQVKILIHENFVNNRQEVRALFSFLGVEPDFAPTSIAETVNAESPKDVQISDRVDNFLRDYYHPSNQKLAARCNVDLSMWRAPLSSRQVRV